MNLQYLYYVADVKENHHRKLLEFPCMSQKMQQPLQLCNEHKILCRYFAKVLLCQHLTTHQLKINNLLYELSMLIKPRNVMEEGIPLCLKYYITMKQNMYSVHHKYLLF
jgi:hypothetical protein